MGLEVGCAYAGARELLDCAASVLPLLGIDLLRQLERGGPALTRTEVIQPLLVAVGLGAALALLEAGVRPAFVAGHSLGELSAWAAAGGVSARTSIRLAALRGQRMADEASRSPGGMVALPPLEAWALEALLGRAAEVGGLEPAAHNAPGEWVVSGPTAALELAMRVPGAQRLRVAGPWHSRWMAGAVEPLRSAFGEAESRPPDAALIVNRSGAVVTTPASLPTLLAEQLVRPVRWAETLESLARAGVTDVVIAPPGRVLRGLLFKNPVLQARVHSLEDPADLTSTIEALCR